MEQNITYLVERATQGETVYLQQFTRPMPPFTCVTEREKSSHTYRWGGGIKLLSDISVTVKQCVNIHNTQTLYINGLYHTYHKTPQNGHVNGLSLTLYSYSDIILATHPRHILIT